MPRKAAGAGPARTRTQGQQARAQYDKAGTVGGSKRRRTGATMATMNRSAGYAPSDLIRQSGGFRFSARKATPEQVAALRAFLVDHVRDVAIGQYADLGAETLAEATGLSAPTVRSRARQGLPVTLDSAEVLMTAEALARMHRGTLAGPLGYPATHDADGLFRRMEFPPGDDFPTQVDRLNLNRRYGVDLKSLFAAFKLDMIAARNHKGR